MKQMTDLDVFVRVVEAASYATAAKALGISRSHASRMVTGLEARLGVRLLHRTTRRVSPTQTGQSLYESCAPLLDALASAESRAASERDDVVGTLRISAPAQFGLRYLAAPFIEFQKRHPGLHTVLDFSDRKVDLIAEGVDLAIRGGSVDNPSLVAKRLWPFQIACYAAPAYIAEHPLPTTPAGLAGHRALLFGPSALPRVWRLQRNGDEVVISVNGPLMSTSSEAIVVAAKMGLGIAYLPDSVLSDEVARGELVRVLPGWSGPSSHYWAVRPHRTHLPARVRLFIEFLSGLYADPPWSRVRIAA